MFGYKTISIAIKQLWEINGLWMHVSSCITHIIIQNILIVVLILKLLKWIKLVSVC